MAGAWWSFTSRKTPSGSASKRGSKLSLGFGLAGIRERVDLSGGKFTAGPEEDDWVVTVELPHTESEAASVGGPSAYIH